MLLQGSTRGSGGHSSSTTTEVRPTVPNSYAPAIVACDINPLACSSTLATARANNVSTIDVIHADLCSPLLQRLQGAVDVFLFNPPYVPTPDEEVGGHDISAAWAGGERGRRVLDRVYPLIPSLLRKDGIAYIVLVEENDPRELIEWARDRMGMHDARLIATKRAKNELLHVLKLVK